MYTAYVSTVITVITVKIAPMSDLYSFEPPGSMNLNGLEKESIIIAFWTTFPQLDLPDTLFPCGIF